MIDELASLLKKKYNHRLMLRDAPDTCCQECDLEVHNFDEVKKAFFGELMIEGYSLKSVDFIYIPTQRDELHLIEMKRKPATVGCRDFVRQHLEFGAFRAKCVDSLFVILGLVGFNGTAKTFYNYFFNRKKLKIRSFFLSNFTDEEFLNITLASLENLNITLTNQIDPEITILNCTEFAARYK